MFTYRVQCNEYILKILKRAHEREQTIPLDKAKWNDLKPHLFEVTFPSPLSHTQKRVLEEEGARFVFG